MSEINHNELRHAFDPFTTRKPSTWQEAGGIPGSVAHGCAAQLDALPTFHIDGGPMDDLPPWVAEHYQFIAVHDGDTYYVNTEGFSYCRYVARL